MSTLGRVLSAVAGGTLAVTAWLAAPAAAQADAGSELIDRWLTPGEQELGTPVTDPPISSFGNEPQIPPSPVRLERALFATMDGGPFGSSVDDILGDLGLACGSTLPFVSCPSPGTPGIDASGPFLIAGAAFDGPLPLSGPSDSLLELGVELYDPATGAVYTAPPEYPNDYFDGLNQCVRTYFTQGAWTAPAVDLFDGQDLTSQAQPFPALTIITSDRFVLITPLGPFERARIYGFRTLLDNPYAPETVTATIFPSLADGPFDLGQVPEAASVLDEIDEPPSSTTTTDADAPADAEVGVEPASSDDDDDGGFPWLLLGIPVVGLALGGTALKLRKQPVAAIDQDDPLDADTIAGLQREFGTPDGGTVAASSEVGWQTALGDEHAAQERVLNAYGELVATWATETGRVRDAMLRYGEAYTRAWQGSDALQQLVRDWEVRRVGAKAADLAVTLATLTIGIGRLGVAGYRAYRAMALAGKTADEAAALLRHADDVIAQNQSLKDLVAQLAREGYEGQAEVRQLVLLAEEAGVSVTQYVDDVFSMFAGRPMGLSEKVAFVFKELAEKVWQARGLERAAPDVVRTISNILTQRAAIMRGGQLSQDTVNALKAFRKLEVSRPDFWQWLPKLFTDFSFATGKADKAVDALTMITGAEDIHFLYSLRVALAQCGDDLTKLPNYLAEALGPAKATALAAGEGLALTSEGAALASAAVNAGVQTTTAVGGALKSDPDPTIYGAVGEADAFVLQFGLTGHLGADAWSWVCNPIETTTGWYHGMEGMDLYQELIEEHGDDLTELGPAAADAISALQRLLDALRDAGLGTPGGGRLGDALGDLGDARRGLQDAAAGDPSLAPRLQERLDHIDRKVATIEGAREALAEVAGVLPGLIAQLQDITHDDAGNLQGAMEHLDPDLAIALAKLLQLFEGAGYRVLGGETAPPLDLSPEDERQLEEVRRAHERMLAGEEPQDWEVPSFDDLPPPGD